MSRCRCTACSLSVLVQNISIMELCRKALRSIRLRWNRHRQNPVWVKLLLSNGNRNIVSCRSSLIARIVCDSALRTIPDGRHLPGTEGWRSKTDRTATLSLSYLQGSTESHLNTIERRSGWQAIGSQYLRLSY